MITHYGGIPCDLDKIYKLCGKRINVIEDAATALGAEYKKKKLEVLKDLFLCSVFMLTK